MSRESAGQHLDMPVMHALKGIMTVAAGIHPARDHQQPGLWKECRGDPEDPAGHPVCARKP